MSLYSIFLIGLIILVLNAHVSLAILLLLLFIAIVLFGIIFYQVGFKLYQQGRQPITEQEVEQSRRQERTALLKYALGELPSELKVRNLVGQGIIGIFSTTIGISTLISHHPAGIIPLLVGIAIVLIVFKERIRAKRLVSESAKALADQLTHGEFTEGNKSEQ